jgi:hypothetical protein
MGVRDGSKSVGEENRNMADLSGTKAWIAAGVALLVAVAIVPALSGVGNAAPITATTPNANNSTQWSYGGEGWSNGSFQFGNSSMNWSGMYGWTVTFTVTSMGSGIWMIEEQRTVGATLALTLSTPVRSVQYHYHAQEIDTAFANLTNASVVYVNGASVPALGVLNASATVNGSVAESVSATFNGHSRSAYLNATGSGHSQTSFSPSLGLIPLNLSGVNSWNSSATASPSAAWNVSWVWSDQGFNGTVRSGSGSANGSLSAHATVTLNGYKVAIVHPFTDHKTRVGIVLVVSGPFNCYDAFIFVPHGLSLFGGAPQQYDSLSFASSAISSEALFVSPGPGGPAVTAADQTFGSSQTVLAGPTGGDASPSAGSSSPGTTVEGQPLTSQQAQAIDHGLTSIGGPGSVTSVPGSMGSGLLVVGVVVAVIAVIVATVGVVEWRSYARRRSKGGPGASGVYGVPPAPPPAPGLQSPPAQSDSSPGEGSSPPS